MRILLARIASLYDCNGGMEKAEHIWLMLCFREGMK